MITKHWKQWKQGQIIKGLEAEVLALRRELVNVYIGVYAKVGHSFLIGGDAKKSTKIH